MKKIIKYVFVLGIMAFFSSCEDKDLQRIPVDEFEAGPNSRINVDPNFGFINLDDLANAKIKYDLYSESTNLSTIELQVFLTVGGVNSDTIVVESYTQAEITAANGVFLNEEVTAQELVTAVGTTLNALTGGNSFGFINKVTMANGTVYPSPTVNGNTNVTPNIRGANATTSYNIGFTAFVGCPSPTADITGTTYTASILTYNSAGAAPFGLPQTSVLEGVTMRLKGPEPFRYEVSSHDAGWWARPDITGTEGGPADFFDICGIVITQPIGSFGFGGAADNGGGTYDPATGIITMNWVNSNNDIFGDVTYVPE